MVIYVVEADNGESYDDHTTHVIGVATTWEDALVVANQGADKWCEHYKPYVTIEGYVVGSYKEKKATPISVFLPKDVIPKFCCPHEVPGWKIEWHDGGKRQKIFHSDWHEAVKLYLKAKR